MDKSREFIIDNSAVNLALIEIKLSVNQNLYNQGAITEEMYTKAKELIIKSR